MSKKKFDVVTMIGLVVALGGLGIGYYLEGGDFAALYGISSILIIFGGTLGVTITTMRMSEIKNLPRVFKKIFEDEEYDYQEVIDNLCEWARITRRDGLLALDEVVKEIKDPFIKRGIGYVLEGNDYETIKELLETEVEMMMERHHKGAKPFVDAGGFAPTMGIIGAVMGLVVVLAGLGSASVEELGHGIAVAFTATLLGVGFANIVCLPFAEKLKNKSDVEVLYRMIIIEGVLGISTGKNHEILRSKLVSYLPDEYKEESSEDE